MAEQLPVDFEFRANQTFAGFFSGGSDGAEGHSEIVEHLKNCADGTGEQFIFLWGSSGLGKSHLLQAACHHAHQAQRLAFYFALNKTQLPEPVLLADLDAFDLVCLDDIDHIAGNEAWEQALFNFFNLHRQGGRQLIVSARHTPKQIGIQLPDLQTRLNWGLTLKLKAFNEADSIAALSFKAEQLGFSITPQAGRFLLTHYERDLASLWKLLAKLDRASLSAKRKLTVPFLKEVLAEIG
jgi:DnaA family protein